MINFITNLTCGMRSGGYTARNAAAYEALARVYDVNYAGPIDPPVNLVRKAHSKALRISGFPGDYFFYSEERLEAVAARVAAACRPDAEFEFFHGFTPWIRTRPARPYIAWNDCSFHDYMNIFHRREEFRREDLIRIELGEAAWLRGARLIVFRSEWAAQRTIDHYGLDPGRVRAVNNFGEMPMPDHDAYAGGREFVFISTDFEAKGGRTLLEAFRAVVAKYPEARLVIVGDRPPLQREPGVEVVGFLRKEAPADVERLKEILTQARALVHPTRSDVSPAVLVEAAYFGCPVISARSFAIPEVVEHGRTGLLLDDVTDVDALTAAMCNLLEDEGRYRAMRRAAWSKSRRENSREAFEHALLGHVAAAMVPMSRRRRARSCGGAGPDPRPLINFVTNLPKSLRSGGFSAMNYAAHAALSRVARINYAGPIDPAPILGEKALSKAARVAGGGGNFFFYSNRRLATIATEVALASAPSAELDFFHGFTPWVLTRPTRPFVAWSDCTFRDYIYIYHGRENFRAQDLRRIERAEAEWLNRAERVLFTSEWARRRAVANYGLDPERTGCVGIFGEIEPPERDGYAGGKSFIFVSTDFEAKGGPTVLAAFRILRARHPDATLSIIGDQPPLRKPEQGIDYFGYLRKEVAQEAARFTDLMSRARAVVHPTRSDIAPLLLIEAGYFGCPVIASRRFAIPELVEEGQTGLLLADPSNVTALADAMEELLVDEIGYRAMRLAAWKRAREIFPKARFAERLVAALSPLLNVGTRLAP
jgi:glycosyltransferase involved in cell wall biosynthesis